MVISHVPNIRLLESPFSFSAIPLLVLTQHTKEHDRTRNTTHPNQCQTGPVTSAVQRLLSLKVNVTSHDPTQVANSNLHRRRNRSLVVPRHVVGQPRDRHGLGDVTTADDEEQGKVLDADGHACLAEQNDVADAGDGHADHAEGVAVTDAVGEVGREDGQDYETVRSRSDGQSRTASHKGSKRSVYAPAATMKIGIVRTCASVAW